MRRIRRLGDIADIGSGILNTIGSAAQVAAEVVADPALPYVVSDLSQLHSLEVEDSGPNTRGIGLSRLVTPLHVYVAYRQNPIIMGALIIAAVVGLPMFIGYTLGKRKRG